MHNVIIINETDNVGVALETIPTGGVVILPTGEEFTARDEILYSHKVALYDIPQGGVVRKYGEVIGATTGDMAQGSWIHTHNLDVEHKGGPA